MLLDLVKPTRKCQNERIGPVRTADQRFAFLEIRLGFRVNLSVRSSLVFERAEFIHQQLHRMFAVLGVPFRDSHRLGLEPFACPPPQLIPEAPILVAG